MTGSPINANSLSTLKIGNTIEFISTVVIIVDKCASMLVDYPLFEGDQLNPTGISFQGEIFILDMGRNCS